MSSAIGDMLAGQLTPRHFPRGDTPGHRAACLSLRSRDSAFIRGGWWDLGPLGPPSEPSPPNALYFRHNGQKRFHFPASEWKMEYWNRTGDWVKTEASATSSVWVYFMPVCTWELPSQLTRLSVGGARGPCPRSLPCQAAYLNELCFAIS